MKSHAQIQELLQELDTLSTDFNGIALAAELISNGFAKDKIQFKNTGIFHRNVNKDIAEIEFDKFEEDNEDIVIHLSKEGLYDMLPDSIFHKPGFAHATETLAEQVARKKKEEQDAKQFFSIFEHEFHYYGLHVQLTETEIYGNANAANNAVFFEYFFGSATLLNDAQIQMLLYLMPLSYKIRTDTTLIEKVYTKLLAQPVSISKSFTEKKYIQTTIEDEDLLLGVNFVAGNAISCYAWQYDISIAQLSDKQYMDYQYGGYGYNLIHFLNKYFIPAIADVHINLIPEEKSSVFTTSTQEQSTYLTFNSTI
jgi:type VI secretion system protein ImpH